VQDDERQGEDTWLGFSIIAIIAVAVAIAVGATVSTLLDGVGTSSAKHSFLSWFSGLTAGAAFAALAYRR
jgi:lipoprotein signal peptidase